MLKIPFTKSKNPTPHDFNALLSSVQNTGFENVINDLILRCQGQAYYSTANVGHYGLGLADYCHFTSPIRRYADVIIHHLLIDAYKLGQNKVKTFDLESIGKAVSKTERQAVASERYATERFLAHFLKDKKGSIFDAVITGVMQSGLFVTVKGLQAEGFIPKRILQQRFPKEKSTYFDQGKMIMRIGKKTFQLGQEHKVVLIESNPETCSITFQMVE
jgi:ribonuclease R